MDARAWYLLYTKPRQEQRADENLKRQGYTTYLPLIAARKRKERRYVDVVEPMFSRYLFLNLDCENDNWGPIRSTIGVSGLVRFGHAPAKIPDALVEEIQAHADTDGVYRKKQTSLKKGQRVRITDGVFAGYEAIFQATSSKERVLLLLDFAGKEAPVELAEGLVVSA